MTTKKHQKVCATLNYIEYFLILGSTINGYISISSFASMVGIAIGITNSAVGLKIRVITVAIKRYQSIIQKKKKKLEKKLL